MTTLRMRRDGHVAFEKSVSTMGTTRLTWGRYVADRSTLLLFWERRSGDDECPNADGVEIVKLGTKQGSP